MKPKIFLVDLLVALAGGLISESAIAKDSSKLRTDRIKFSYVAPENSEHQDLYKLLKERRVLERIKGLLSPLRLPRPLLVKTARCDGDANAFYDDDSVTVCYEYIDELLRNAPREKTPAGVTRQHAVVGPTIEVFCMNWVMRYLTSRIMRVMSASLLLQFPRFRKQFVDHIHLFPREFGTSEMAVCCGVQVNGPVKLQMVDHSLRG
jgi:hypothetical protein